MTIRCKWKLEDITPSSTGDQVYRESMVEALRSIAEELAGVRSELKEVKRLLLGAEERVRVTTRF